MQTAAAGMERRGSDKMLTCALEQVADQIEDRPHLLRADDAIQQQQLRELGQARSVVRRVSVLLAEIEASRQASLRRVKWCRTETAVNQ